ncbi:hypothetical protein [Parerythrobacter jejuensis]|uniref:Uncharacterized protein n=1 Tax=Parerythrobacter jejuensis TaxID=795812 RepID=A0A845ATD7_9SPHN|nr:hypothetical protein [Parerythrobacter jejuensis]MXP32275.1 hypothetical protein [Parerythrobacter jejuensis]
MDKPNPQDDGSWIGDAKDEMTGIAKEGMAHPSTKPVLAGAAIGALAGGLLPIVTWPVGLAAGAIYALHNRIKK